MTAAEFDYEFILEDEFDAMYVFFSPYKQRLVQHCQ